ncbi:MAG: 3-methyl-2-oxobutanoate hydroxymethyltransferase [Planctomycetia bacterium]|jgi:3-methyl-2-oxobutanoate hydroxymethyltransferase
MKKITTKKLIEKKKNGEPIVMITAYDYPSARLVDEAGVDIILVGDSLGMVVQGHKDTLPVTLDQMIYHTEMVQRATRRAMVVADMPFPTFQLGPTEAIRNAARILKETGCDAVKIEGGAKRAETVAALVEADIPVMGHVGLLPQASRLMGEFRLQRERERIVSDAMAIQEAGAFAIVLECTESSIADEVTRSVAVPTISIGAGPGCDGQVLVFHDLLGFGTSYIPRHVKLYAEIGKTITDAVAQYAAEVRERKFPEK